MNTRENQITASAERIEEVCQKSRKTTESVDIKVDVARTRKQVKGIHISSIRFSTLRLHSLPKGYDLLKKPIHNNAKIKKLQDISILAPNLATPEEQNTPVYKAATEANNCCWKRDLHLFNYMKVFSEHHIAIRKVACWKLPKQAIAKGLLSQSTSPSERKAVRQGHHRYMRILIGGLKQKAAELELEKNLKEQLEIQKGQKETRNYSQRPSLFS